MDLQPLQLMAFNQGEGGGEGKILIFFDHLA